MKLTKKQTEALDYLEDQTTTELYFGGGAGGGKSALGCYWQLKKRIKYPGTRGLIGRAKLKTLKDTTLQTFKEIAAKQGFKDGRDYTITSANHKEYPTAIVFWGFTDENDYPSLIYLRDLFAYPADPEFDDLGSLELTDAFVDESPQITPKAKGILKSRIRYKLDENELVPKLLMTGNPAKNWTYRQFYHPWKKEELPAYRKFIQSLLTDNPNISKHYRENLLTLDKTSMARLLYGEWEYDDDPAVIMDADAISDYFNPIHIQRTGEMYMTIDVARKGKDKTVFRVWDDFLCIERHFMPVSRINEIVDKAKGLQAIHGIPTSRVAVDEDGVGGGVVDYLEGCYGFVNNSTPIDEPIDGEYKRPNYDNLKSQCSIRMGKRIAKRQAGEIAYSDDVKEMTSEEMEQVKIKDIDKDGKLGIVPKQIVTEKLGRSPDDWDSIMMREVFALTPETVFFNFT